MLQAVVIQDPVIYPFTGGTFTVYFPVLFGIPGDAWLKTQVSTVLYINGTAIASG